MYFLLNVEKILSIAFNINYDNVQTSTITFKSTKEQH